MFFPPSYPAVEEMVVSMQLDDLNSSSGFFNYDNHSSISNNESLDLVTRWYHG
jgi:hypothetical protein